MKTLHEETAQCQRLINDCQSRIDTAHKFMFYNGIMIRLLTIKIKLIKG